MAALAYSYPSLCTRQTVLPEQERDPRASEPTDVASYLSRLHAYMQYSVQELLCSQVKAMDVDFAPLEKQLDGLTHLQEGWDGYDAPTPSTQAIEQAQNVLRGMQGQLIRPQWISASADGGVAFSFAASDKRRAQIEVLNNGEKFVHLYDLDGNSHTEEWQGNVKDRSFNILLEPIIHYLQG